MNAATQEKLDWRQYINLAFVTFWIGVFLGQERTIVPLLAKSEFGIASATVAFSFLISFGIVKSLFNFIAGGLNDRFGRRTVLVSGWIVGLPVPFMLMYASSWSWIVVANFLLGAQCALTWTTTIVAQVDIAGPKRRGFSIGFNECAGYGGVALGAFLSGSIAEAYGMRPWPFVIGAVAVVSGLISSLFVKDTRDYCQREMKQDDKPKLKLAEVVRHTLWEDSQLRFLCIAGVAQRLLDGMVWVGVPVLLHARGFSLGEIGLVTSVYLLTWCVFQWITGTLSDAAGRRPFIIVGFLLGAAGMMIINSGEALSSILLGALVLGLGMGSVFPTVMAAVSDEASPIWRASALGVFRLCMDGGYALAAVMIGLLIDGYGEAAPGYVISGTALLASLYALTGYKESLSLTLRPMIWKTTKIVYQLLPIKLLFTYARIKGFVQFLFSKNLPRIRRNMVSLLGDYKRESELRVTLRKFHQHQETRRIIRVWIKIKRFAKSARLMSVRGLKHLDAALEQGNGALLLTANFGHYRLITYMLRQRGYKTHLVSLQPLTDREELADENYLGNMLYGLMKSPEIEGIKGNDVNVCFNIRPLLDVLRRNEVLVILADDLTAMKFVDATLFGKPYSVSTGTVSLARKTGAPVLPAFVVDHRNETGFELMIENPLPINSDSRGTEKVTADINNFMRVYETFIQNYPDHFRWLNPASVPKQRRKRVKRRKAEDIVKDHLALSDE